MSPSINLSEESFRQLVENVRDYAIIILDADGKVQSWNNGAEQMYGYTTEEITGAFISLFYIPEEIQAEYPVVHIQQATEYGRYECEGWRVNKVGQKFWADVIYTVLYNEEGKVRGFLKITRDITEKKLQLEQVMASNYFLDTILENIPNMVFVKDAQHLRFVRFNKAGEKLLGYKKEDLIGKNDYDFFPADQADFFIAKDREVLERGEVFDIPEEPIDTANGKRWLHTQKIPVLDQNGKPIYLLGISEDITGRKKAQEHIATLNIELENKIVELEHSNKELESFSYSVSHDLRTPLRAINGYTRILEETYSNLLNDEGRRMMRSVSSNAYKMGQLIDDLLAFSRVGKKELQKNTINMRALVEQVIQEMERGTQNFKHDIVITKLPDAWGDVRLIQQVYINLISNAVKYSQPKENPRIEIGAYREDEEVVYYITDNGVGFDMRYYDKLFGVFQRLHSVEEFEGTGVGLALVYRIIHRHGGRVWAESKLGSGSSFYFTLADNEE